LSVAVVDVASTFDVAAVAVVGSCSSVSRKCMTASFPGTTGDVVSSMFVSLYISLKSVSTASLESVASNKMRMSSRNRVQNWKRECTTDRESNRRSELSADSMNRRS